MKGRKLNIAVVDDHNLFRKGLIKLINLGDSDGIYNILIEAEDGKDLKNKLDKTNLPDIVLMDINMPEMDGFETVDWLNKYYPDINILVISMLETEESILRMLRMGVKGYLSKDIEVEDMHAALKAIANKGFYYSDLVSEIMLQNIQQGEVKSVQDIEFSEKDREFLKLVCSEMTYQQIADKMNLSPKTIEGYREALFKRLKVKNRVSLALYAVKHGYFRME